jgi:integrase
LKRGLKGNGSITRKSSGKWLVKVPLGRTSKGATRYSTKTCDTKTEARRWHTDLLVRRESHALIAGPRQTLRQYSIEVLFNANDQISDRTRDGYYRNLKRHVFPVLGSVCLSEVSPQDLDAFLSQMRRSYSASTVNNVRIGLSKVFASALVHGLVAFNPVARTRKAKRGEFDRTQVCLPWNEDEALEALQAAKGTKMEAFLTLALATGMRRGELFGLRWSDLYFQANTVSIERTVHSESILQRDGITKRKVVVAPPKTASSRRINQLTNPVIDVLIRHQVEQELARGVVGDSWDSANYVFTNSRGGPLDESNFSKQWARFIVTNGLRHIRIHDLRHTFATMLMEDDSGKLASISKALGHSSIGITMDIYAKTARVETQATSRMSELLFPGHGRVAPISVPSPGRVDSIAPGHRRAT